MHGWAKNGESMLNLATNNACPISQRLDKMNIAKHRGWNYFLAYTKDHVIQFIFADLTLACSNTVIVFDRDNINESLFKLEDKSCANFDKDKLASVASLNSTKLSMNVETDKKKISKVSIDSFSRDFSADFTYNAT